MLSPTCSPPSHQPPDAVPTPNPDTVSGPPDEHRAPKPQLVRPFEPGPGTIVGFEQQGQFSGQSHSSPDAQRSAPEDLVLGSIKGSARPVRIALRTTRERPETGSFRLSYFTPEVQQLLAEGSGTMFFSQHIGTGAWMPAST